MPTLKKFDVIKIQEQVFIVFDLKKDYLELLSVATLEENDLIIPRIQLGYSFLHNYEKIDSDIILWWLHSKNPLIKKVVENFLYEKE